MVGIMQNVNNSPVLKHGPRSLSLLRMRDGPFKPWRLINVKASLLIRKEV